MTQENQGVTCAAACCVHMQLNKERVGYPVTNKNVAQYFREIGTAALQAVPYLQAEGLIADTHTLLQHPAFNNEEYREYAAQQAAYSKRVMAQFKLLETPVLGPVFTQATAQGNMSSALGTQDSRQNMMTAAVVTYAASAAAAYTQARGANLSGRADFMLVSPEERELLLACRSASQPQQARAAAAGAIQAVEDAAASTAAGATAANPPAAAAAADSSPAAASASGAAAEGAAGSTPAAAAAAASPPAAASASGAAAQRAASSTPAAPAASTPAAASGSGAAAERAVSSTPAAAAAASMQATAGASGAAAAGATPVHVEGNIDARIVSGCVCSALQSDMLAVEPFQSKS